ncbi:hypothetical protein E9993_19955 [Labilibacter sediminis]|nr:hypothetical protein E9993_19955 [Labilibacter sediminis]
MRTLTLLLFVSFFSFISCSESVLSDVDISDPGTLKVKVKIQQNEDLDKEIQVFIRDKNNKPVDLLTGQVIVNNTRTRFERAQVNALGTRGYIYVPKSSEQEFEITIFWNSNESFSFDINEDNGFSGFFRNYAYGINNDGNTEFYSKSYNLKPSPFYEDKIDVQIKIPY